MTGRNWIALVVAAATMAGCASKYTIVDRSAITISDSARISAQNLVADAQRFPQVADHLALAQEVYQRQLYLLKERRNKVRARRRNFGILSFAAMTAGALATSYLAVAGNEEVAPRDLDVAALIGLGAIGVGTGTQVASLTQEDASAIDAKVRQLELQYDTMMQRLRDLSRQATVPVCDPSLGSPCPAVVTPVADLSARMGEVIEEFVTSALAINIKG
jgi:hypothetical protein